MKDLSPGMLNISSWPFREPTLVSVAQKYAEQKPQHIPFKFIDFSGQNKTCKSMDYQTFDVRARQIAAFLQTQGQALERVVLAYPSGLDYICAFYGCLYAGMIAVPVYPPLTPQLRERLLSIIKNSGATICLSTSTVLESLTNEFNNTIQTLGLKWLAIEDNLLQDFEHVWKEPAINNHDIAFLQYTSGSTGQPKGVIVSHENILANLQSIAVKFHFNPDDHIFSWLPPYHDMGLIGSLLGGFTSGIPLSFMSPAAFLRRPNRWLKEISENRCTISGAPNFAYDLCIKRVSEEHKQELDLSCWKLAYSGAEPVRVSTLRAFSEAFVARGFDDRTFFPCYGLAESTLLVACVDRGSIPTVLANDTKSQRESSDIYGFNDAALKGSPGNLYVSCGTPSNDYVLHIVDPQTSQILPDRVVGEIWVKGPSVTIGYWERKEETHVTFQAFISHKDGPYMRTGDLGFKVGSEVFICGRLKDIIINRGVNIYPHDIEDEVSKCHELIKFNSGIAFSILDDNIEYLVYVQEIGQRDLDSASSLISSIKKCIAETFEVQIHEIVLIESGNLPKTTSGKLCRQPCRERYRNGDLSVLIRWRNPLTERLE